MLFRTAIVVSLCAITADTSAQAELRFCNKTAKPVSFAVGRMISGQWVTNGYWRTESGKCAAVVPGDLNQRYYYSFAVRDDGRKWTGPPWARGQFCEAPGPMNRVTNEACASIGGKLVNFSKIDTGNQKFHEVTFSVGDEVVVDERVYEATCFNIRKKGGFVSKSLQELVASKEAEAIGIAICTYYSGQAPACLKTAIEGTKIVNKLTRAGGSDYWGTIHARPGYEVCRAFWDTRDWSVTSATTFNTTIVKEAGKHSLGYYASLPVGRSRGDWIDTKVILEQVPIGTRANYDCWAAGRNPWICKGSGCSSEMPGARVSLPSGTGNGLCVKHGK